VTSESKSSVPLPPQLKEYGFLPKEGARYFAYRQLQPNDSILTRVEWTPGRGHGGFFKGQILGWYGNLNASFYVECMKRWFRLV